jgi:hypothetical protein
MFSYSGPSSADQSTWGKPDTIKAKSPSFQELNKDMPAWSQFVGAGMAGVRAPGAEPYKYGPEDVAQQVEKNPTSPTSTLYDPEAVKKKKAAFEGQLYTSNPDLGVGTPESHHQHHESYGHTHGSHMDELHEMLLSKNVQLPVDQLSPESTQQLIRTAISSSSQFCMGLGLAPRDCGSLSYHIARLRTGLDITGDGNIGKYTSNPLMGADPSVAAMTPFNPYEGGTPITPGAGVAPVAAPPALVAATDSAAPISATPSDPGADNPGAANSGGCLKLNPQLAQYSGYAVNMGSSAGVGIQGVGGMGGGGVAGF